VIFEVLPVVSRLRSSGLMTPCGLVDRYERFEGMCYVHVQANPTGDTLLKTCNLEGNLVLEYAL
jgi:hypothetical protein